MLTNQEKNQIKQILQSPQWATIERLANLLCDQINSDSTVKDDQWDTLKTTILQEGEVRGIRKFIQEMYKNAQ